MFWLVCISLLPQVLGISPPPPPPPDDRSEFGTRTTNTGIQTTPTLLLPYATYQANSYDSINDIWVFANIRFAAAPTGTLRWAAPSAAHTVSGVQNGSFGYNKCPQFIPPSSSEASRVPIYLVPFSNHILQRD